MWKKDLKTLVLLLLTMLIWAVVYNMLTSCTRTVSKAVETHDTVWVEHHTADTTNVQEKATDTVYVVRTDTLTRTDIRHDSIVVRDSVYVREKGDSVYVYKEKWRTKVDVRHDTVYRSKTDTVVRTKTDTVTIYRFVERKDSTGHISQSSREKVKERVTISWLKVLGALSLCLAVFGIWYKLNK